MSGLLAGLLSDAWIAAELTLGAQLQCGLQGAQREVPLWAGPWRLRRRGQVG